MPQPNAVIQDSQSNQNIGKLWFNRNQYLTFRYFGTTTNNTATELFIDGITNNRLKIPDASACLVRCDCVIFNITDSFSGGVGKTAVVENLANVVTLAGAEQATPALWGDNANAPGGTIVISASDANDAVVFTVTGTSAKTIAYEALVTVVCATSPESNFGVL